MVSLEKIYLKQLSNKTSVYLSPSMMSVYYFRVIALPIIFAKFFLFPRISCLPFVTSECSVGFNLEYYRHVTNEKR